MPDDELGDGRFSYESALWHTEQQNGRVRDIRARLSLAISVNSLVIAVFAVALAAWIPEPGAAIQALSVVILVILVIFSVGIIGAFLALRESLDAPSAEPDDIHEVEREFGEAEARDLATRSMIDVYAVNKPLIARTERWLQIALAATVANAIIAPATIIAGILL